MTNGLSCGFCANVLDVKYLTELRLLAETKGEWSHDSWPDNWKRDTVKWLQGKFLPQSIWMCSPYLSPSIYGEYAKQLVFALKIW